MQPTLPTDELEIWIDAVRQGETEKYELIVRAFQQPIFRYCYRLFANRQDAEDAVQDILVKAFQSLDQYRSTGSFQAWLYLLQSYSDFVLAIERIESREFPQAIGGYEFEYGEISPAVPEKGTKLYQDTLKELERLASQSSDKENMPYTRPI